ncbi:MAG: hypothetical protein WBV74_01105 [Pseudonocardiaceae bacterium]
MALHTEVAELEAQVAELEAQVAALSARVTKQPRTDEAGTGEHPDGGQRPSVRA